MKVVLVLPCRSHGWVSPGSSESLPSQWASAPLNNRPKHQPLIWPIISLFSSYEKKKKRVTLSDISKAQIFSDPSWKLSTHLLWLPLDNDWVFTPNAAYVTWLIWTLSTDIYVIQALAMDCCTCWWWVWSGQKLLLGHSPEQQLGHHYEVYIRVKMTCSFFAIILEKYKALWLTLNWVYTYTHHTISTHWTTEQLLQNHPNLLNHILLCCNITPQQLLWILSYSLVKNITVTHPTLGRVPGSQGLPGHLLGTYLHHLTSGVSGLKRFRSTDTLRYITP